MHPTPYQHSQQQQQHQHQKDKKPIREYAQAVSKWTNLAMSKAWSSSLLSSSSPLTVTTTNFCVNDGFPFDCLPFPTTLFYDRKRNVYTIQLLFCGPSCALRYAVDRITAGDLTHVLPLISLLCCKTFGLPVRNRIAPPPYCIKGYGLSRPGDEKLSEWIPNSMTIEEYRSGTNHADLETVRMTTHSQFPFEIQKNTLVLHKIQQVDVSPSVDAAMDRSGEDAMVMMDYSSQYPQGQCCYYDLHPLFLCEDDKSREPVHLVTKYDDVLDVFTFDRRFVFCNFPCAIRWIQDQRAGPKRTWRNLLALYGLKSRRWVGPSMASPPRELLSRFSHVESNQYAFTDIAFFRGVAEAGFLLDIVRPPFTVTPMIFPKSKMPHGSNFRPSEAIRSHLTMMWSKWRQGNPVVAVATSIGQGFGSGRYNSYSAPSVTVIPPPASVPAPSSASSEILAESSTLSTPRMAADGNGKAEKTM